MIGSKTRTTTSHIHKGSQDSEWGAGAKKMNITGPITRQVGRLDTAASLLTFVKVQYPRYRYIAQFSVAAIAPKENEKEELIHCPLKDTGYCSDLVVDSTGSLRSTAICRFHSDLQPYPRHGPISGARYQAAAGTVLPTL